MFISKGDAEYNIGKYKSYIQQLKVLIRSCDRKQYRLSLNNRVWEIGEDARLSFWRKIISSLTSTLIEMNLLYDSLKSERWTERYWEIVSDSCRLSDDLPSVGNHFYLKQLDNHLRASSFLFFVSEFENSIMIINRFLKIEDNRYSNNYIEFIRDDLIFTESTNLFKIIRHLRNTIHSNGIYIDRDKYIPYIGGWPLIEVKHKERVFKFKMEEPVNITWEDCFFLYKELLDLFELIIDHKVIVEQERIKDPIYGF